MFKKSKLWQYNLHTYSQKNFVLNNDYQQDLRKSAFKANMTSA
jgi:hypothetical protein